MSKWSVLRMAALGLIVLGVVVVVGAVYLISLDKDVPDGIIALGSAAVGALATLMTTSQFGGSDDAPGTTTVKVEKVVSPETP